MTSNFLASEFIFIVDPAKINLKRVIVIYLKATKSAKVLGW